MSGLIPRPFIDELIARSDIVDIIGSRIKLRKTGVNYQAPCPFHHEKQPSFTVSQDKQFYYCFGCGAHGNAIGFLMEYDRMEFVDAVETLAAYLGLEVPREGGQQPITERFDDLYALMAQTAQFYQRQFRVAENKDIAIRYLKGRGLTGEIAKRFGIGLAPPKWDALLRQLGNSAEAQNQLQSAGMLIQKDDHCYDRFRNRIIFTIRDPRGRVIGFGGRVLSDEDSPKYLNSPESPIFHKGTELYGFYEARHARQKYNKIIVVEGYLDVISLAQFGIENAVATLGTATSTQHLQKLTRHFNDIVFCFDGDRAGRAAAWRALEASLPLMRDGIQITFAFLPEGEDPDSLVRSQGSTGFQNILNQAIPLSDFFFQELTQQAQPDTPDGRARLAKLTSPLLNKMPSGIFRQLMFEKLAKQVKMDVEALEALITRPNTTTTPKTSKVPSSLRLAIMLLLQCPELASNIHDTETLKAYQLPKINILTQLLELLATNPTLKTGAILAHWQDKEEAATLARLAAMDHLIPEEGIQNEFLGALEQLRGQHQQSVIQSLLLKANTEGLSDEEKRKLQQLIQETQ